MAKTDRNEAAAGPRKGQPAELSQAEIEALAAGGKAAEKIRQRMDREAGAGGRAEAAAYAAAAGGKSAPSVKPPGAD